ncbi:MULTISPECIES: membrane protein insertase YidC [Alphaproteobacteria]|uniref:Membrane protein insertase YidC n=2 Tax=Alphaproteobacteria TaxID=28211 RepID=A0A512HDR0_9HYPH|nr:MULTISPECIES: membrane protein insertase YidC [Alphaproteobacteria]GEO83594.1 membrane protein insertase YidC [Ciceribacter naphthalenivorans]GLR24254.1 membrane protein insertase YidC [Ciceribacter naphthalenivorans]GLT07110.1 membrane protein insertase YidC [Sphingomonas psychrolutea]
MQNNRNYFIAIALSVLIVLGWQYFIMSPRIEAQRQAEEARLAQEATTTQPNAAAPAAGTIAGSLPGSTAQAAAEANRDEAIAKTARVAIDTPALVGSINLTGARFDDLKLKEYRETVDPTSPIITLFNPADTTDGYFTELGYIAGENAGTAPGPATVWTLASGDKLTQATPVTLSFTNDAGLTFLRKISVDEHYMFTVEDTISNTGTAAASIAPYGRITRYNKPTTASVYVLHEGFLGVIGKEGGLVEEKYSAIEKESMTNAKATGGWMGITDKYWAAALVPPQAIAYDSRFSHFTDGQPRFQADYKNDAVSIAPGQSTSLKTLVFAGAKEVPVVDGYARDNSWFGKVFANLVGGKTETVTNYEVPRFDLLIDWGWFYFFTKPMFMLMDFFFRLVGNFGIAILLTTIVVKAIFFPLASKQYASMANMKRMQPKMEELKAKYGDDKMALQKAMMELYKTEKINPVAGCWPVLLQIPVFFSLYKVIYVTIEMRHAPFFGWIQDLSAPDPTTFINLFGLLPFEAPSFLHLGIWPIIMGVTMWLQMRMNPTPPDPTQAMLFNWMPLIFTFMLGSFPAGLVIYWAWNNTLSITQQSIIMKRHGAKIELIDNIKRMFRRKPTETK